jgi:flavin-dependent dehydrogenase
MKTNYDAVVIGARVSGAATAMLMARDGADVLLVDRAPLGADTLSTLALMRGAVRQLERWGLLDAVIAAGTPAVTRTVFNYPNDAVAVDIEPLYAPRRTVLDPILVDGARQAGVEVHHGTRAVDVRFDRRGRVTGVELETPEGRQVVGCNLLVGADGLRSWVARRLDVPVTRTGQAVTASIFAHFAGDGLDGHTFHWLYRPGLFGGSIPTNDDQRLVFASVPADRFRDEVREGAPEALHRLIRELDPHLAEAVAAGRVDGHIRSWPGHVGQFRKAHGPGWALVGDAGYFKDPGAAHGMTDALRDAELLARAARTGDFAGYEATRDRLSGPLFEALEQVVDHSWTIDELPARVMRMSKAMKIELQEFERLAEPADDRSVAA